MKQFMPKYFNTFYCLAGACPDTCCAGWDVVIDEKTQLCYKAVPGSFGARLRQEMQKDEDGDIIFKATGGRCPFLSATNLCQIYSTLGESALSETCRLYPRFFNDYGTFQEAGLSLSCPEAAKLILTDTHTTTFYSRDIDTTNTADEQADPNLLNRLVKARNSGITLLQNRRFAYNERLALLLDFTVQLTAGLFSSDLQVEAQLCSLYSTTDDLHRRLKILKETISAPDNHLPKALLQLLKSCEHRTTAFSHQIDDTMAFLNKEPLSASKLWPRHTTEEHYPEHVSVYTLFRYFLESVFTLEPLIQTQHTAIAALAIALLRATAIHQKGGALSPDAYQKIIITYSKEIEHSIPNMEYIEDQLMKDPYLSTDAWIRFLLWDQ